LRYPRWASRIGPPCAFLSFPEVIAALISMLWYHLWSMSFPSSNIAAICCLGSLFAYCIVAAVAGLSQLCHWSLLGPSTVSSHAFVF
jgi:hypothetical protein